MRRNLVWNTESTYVVVELFAAQATQVLDVRGDLCRSSEQHESLVNQVCTQVVCLTRTRKRKILPSALENIPETVESKGGDTSDNLDFIMSLS